MSRILASVVVVSVVAFLCFKVVNFRNWRSSENKFETQVNDEKLLPENTERDRGHSPVGITFQVDDDVGLDHHGLTRDGIVQLRNDTAFVEVTIAELGNLDDTELTRKLDGFASLPNNVFTSLCGPLAIYIVNDRPNMLLTALNQFRDVSGKYDLFINSAGMVFGNGFSSPTDGINSLIKFQDHPTFLTRAAEYIGSSLEIAQSENLEIENLESTIASALANPAISDDSANSIIVGFLTGISKFAPQFSLTELSKLPLSSPELSHATSIAAYNFAKTDVNSAVGMFRDILVSEIQGDDKITNIPNKRFLSAMMAGMTHGSEVEILEIISAPEVPPGTSSYLSKQYLESLNPRVVAYADAQSLIPLIEESKRKEFSDLIDRYYR